MPFVYLAEPVRCSNRGCRETLRTVERVFMRADGSVLCMDCHTQQLNDEPTLQSPAEPEPLIVSEPEPEPEPEPEKPKRKRRKTSKKTAK